MVQLSKKLCARLGIICCFMCTLCSVHAAEPVQRRGGGQVQQTSAPAPAPVSARAARAPATATVSARSGVPSIAARSAAPVVAARAAAAVPTQKVISAATSVAAAASTSGVVDQVCRERFYGCMDSFCMSDTNNGGRCLCSNQQSNLDAILIDIEKLDAATYKMATEGVEKIEMGTKADYVFKQQEAAAKTLEDDKKNDDRRKPPKKKLDLTQWTAAYEEAGILEEGEIATVDPLAGKSGDALHTAARQICLASMPECEKDLRMLQTMYSANISNDCRAFDNELKRRKQSSAQKLAAAEKAMRDAALESYETANKWDLGQCTVEFKKCMITTGGCGEDFTGCVGIAAAQNAASSTGNAATLVSISGTKTTIEIAASSWDALASKRPLCDSVTNSCVLAVQKDKNAVWDTFLREIAPAIKTAELLAESDLRTSCIGNISSCFQKACNDRIDPNDPEGSYDMCLTRPETLSSLCKVQIDPCQTAEPQIMEFVRARLASMRVDSCTKEVKACLTSEDRCGKDYTQCIGLDTNTIVHMCPSDKLVGCQYKYTGATEISGDGIYDELARLVQGIMLGIDNGLLNACQAAVDSKMNEVCGGIADCIDKFSNDANYGTDGMVINLDTADELHIIGLLDFSLLTSELNSDSGETDTTLRSGNNNNNNPVQENNVRKNIKDWSEASYKLSTDNSSSTGEYIKVSQANANNVVSKINQVISMFESDEKIKQCTQGRSIAQIRGAGSTINDQTPRFPNLMDGYISKIVDSALIVAKSNHEKKKAALLAEAMDKIAAIKKAANDISGGGMCYDKSIMGDLDFMK
ncbi:MAG: hypothetical protein LBK26_01545 [Rickettsiales bacterium]|jgi:hypothetical protein|nr:hypothetical protein [Rickettsiales bacterium]